MDENNTRDDSCERSDSYRFRFKEFRLREELD